MKIFLKLKQKKNQFCSWNFILEGKTLNKFHIPTKNLCFRRNCYFFAQVIFILQKKKNKFIFSIIVFISIEETHMDWSCSKSNSGTLICQAVGLFFFVIPKLLHTRRIGSFTFLRCFSPPSHLPLLLHIPFVFINLNCTEVKTLEVIDLYPWTRYGSAWRRLWPR